MIPMPKGCCTPRPTKRLDFLFDMLSLPVSNLISLVGKKGMVGSLANLYESVENLNRSYMQPKNVTPSSAPRLTIHDFAVEKKFYICSGCRYNGSTKHVSDDPRAICPSCTRTLYEVMPYVAPPAAKQFVKGVVTYMVMDDLVVKPVSTISSITLLDQFNVKDVGALEEKVVNLGRIYNQTTTTHSYMYIGLEVAEGFCCDQECS
ncbi:hypothetical protein OROMI_011630 [Orobanche minor]